MTHQLTREQARRIAVRAQLLDASPPGDLHAVVRQLTLLQVDQTAAVAPSADLVAWSRLGAAYTPEMLADARYGRALVELQGMIRPAEDIALYRADMAAWPGAGPIKNWQNARGDWVIANDACRRDVLARLDADGPLAARDLPDTCTVPWESSGWNNNRNVPRLLEFLEERGDVAVAGRQGRERLWDLSERIYPDDPPVPAEEARRKRDELRLRSLGIARSRAAECPVEPQDVGEAGEAAVVEGVKGAWRVDPAYLGGTFSGRAAALLSPIDRLVFDRKRTLELFGFDYQLEMYKPAAKRRWGYYALPILVGDRFVGKLDATADRAAGVLRVNAIHEDVAWTDTVRADVYAEIDALADRLELDLRMR
ncbi:MAG TPA: crosslink repair DNA glycosylase YcaQ family protein [Jatrophihabitantaceae bacterium]